MSGCLALNTIQLFGKHLLQDPAIIIFSYNIVYLIDYLNITLLNVVKHLK